MKSHFHYKSIILYSLVSLADICAVAFSPDLRIFTKPFLMITLGLGFWISTKELSDRRKWYMLTAIGFAFLGDVLLLGESLFLFGLGGFLVMQILYIWIFMMDDNYYGLREYSLGAVLFLLVIGTVYILWPMLGSLGIAVGIYSTTIALMCYSAFTRDFTTSGYWPVFIGSTLFILSDTILALNRFNEPIYMGGVLVMLTYLTAQFLIATGYTDFLIGKNTNNLTNETT